MLPAVIDVEASGFGKDSYPIEIGVALSNGQRHCFLIRPEPEWSHWDEAAEQLHGISRELLAAKGYAAWEVAAELNELLSGELIYSDAWGNDMSWVAKLFDAAGLPQFFRLDSIVSLLNEEQMGSWNSEKEHQFAQVSLQRHRASTDAAAIQRTLAVLLEVADHPVLENVAITDELTQFEQLN